MNDHRREQPWPYLFLLTGLFILSVTSPRAWHGAIGDPLPGGPDFRRGVPLVCRTLTPEPAQGPTQYRVARSVSVPGLTQPPAQAFPSSREFQVVRPAAKIASRPADADQHGPQIADPGMPSATAPTAGDSPASPGAIESPGDCPIIHTVSVGRPPTESASPEAGPKAESPWLPTPPEDGPASDDPVLAVQRPADAQTPPAADARFALWTQPQALFDRLERMAGDRRTSPWAGEVARLVQELGIAVSLHSDESGRILDALQALSVSADHLSAELGEDPMAGEMRRGQHALVRRLDLWTRVIVPGTPLAKLEKLPRPDPRQFFECVAEIDAITAGSTAAQSWQNYLALDALKQAASDLDSFDETYRRALARAVLQRMTKARMTASQQEFLQREALVKLASELRSWAAEPVDPAALLRHVETYEATGLASDARTLAGDIRRLHASPLAGQRELGRRLETHYRNANVRVAVTETLLNRMMPRREPDVQRVRETVLGAPVYGHSVTRTDTGFRLIPDSNRLRLALEVGGSVTAQTTSTRGPATFHNDSVSTYQARKEIELDTSGIRPGPTEVHVENRTDLRRLENGLAGIPLLGWLTNGIARSQYDQKKPLARREVEQTVAARAKSRVDEATEAQLVKLNETLDRRVFEPLDTLSIGPTLIAARTTPERMTTRVRLAGDDQLAGSSPRSRAPADSLLSFQVHESALNNAIEQMDLDGQTLTLTELRRRIAETLNYPRILEGDPIEDGVTITFAKENAVSVQFVDRKMRMEDGRMQLDGGQVVITLSIARLKKSRRQWTNFRIRAFYRPEAAGRSALLVRDEDEVIHLIGKGLKFRSQIALRGIFGKTFHEKRPWLLLPERLTDRPQLSQLAVTQFTVDDGWIGIALGPARPDSYPAVAQRRGVDD